MTTPDTETQPRSVTNPGPSASVSPPSGRDPLRWAEMALALALTTLVLGFHVVRMLNAGGLWRDEIGTANLAANFSVKYVVENAQHELFPVLVPALLHSFTALVGQTDIALRLFGLLVGIGIVAALWLNTLSLRRSVPLLSLALLGFNAAFIQWGDTVRSYGLGVLLILLSTGFLWRFLERPSICAFLAALVASIASVQALFNNAGLLLAACLAAAVVALRRHATRQAAAILLIGFLSALTLLPYWGPIHAIRQWDMLVRVPIGFGNLWSGLLEALSSSDPWSGSLWIFLFVLGAGVSLLPQTRKYSSLIPSRAGEGTDASASQTDTPPNDRELLLFCGSSLLAGFIGYIRFYQDCEVCSTGLVLPRVPGLHRPPSRFGF